MANLFRQNPLAFALAALASLLVVVIALEAAFGLWPSTNAPAPKPPTATEVKMLPPLAAIVPDQAYPETAARPLFTPTRRPAPAALSVASNMQKGQFILTGVMALREQRIALLKEKTSGKVHRVEIGKEVNGMTLSAVEGEKVTLSQGGDQEVLTLQVQKGAAPAPGAVAAAPAGGPFGPVAGAAAPPGQAPGAPAPVATAPAGAPQTPAVPTGVQAAPQPAVTAQPTTPPANPAQRSGFGPFPPGANPSEATPMTPEELLARRRARRGQQQPN